MLLYIHIPFCKRKCRYCSFVSYEEQAFTPERYVRNLIREAEGRKNEFSEELDTVFIGGGTPSLLSPELTVSLPESLFHILSAKKPAEFTIESNPGTVTEQWMAAAVKAGMNRLSIGMQALQPSLLDTLGRIHTFRDVEKTIRIARTYGIRNINIDLIFGIPGQTLAQWKDTIDAALMLEPKHISAYGLIPEEKTPLYNDLLNGKLSLPDPDLERTMYDTVIILLSKQGFRQYEVSNFALPGYECRHNIGYWKQIPYVGLGASAASMSVLHSGDKGMMCLRRKNPDLLIDYEKMVQERSEPAEISLISPPESRFETMMLGLRMNEGIDEIRFREIHGVSVEEIFGEKLHRLESLDLMNHSDHRWKLTRRGFDIQNSILVELMED